MTTDERGIGVFILPIIVVLQLAAGDAAPRAETALARARSPLFWMHVSAMLVPYASFALAAVIGITYVLQFKEIKAKHLGYFFTRLPSLQALDVMNSRAVFIGWACLTVGLIAGALWVGQAPVVAPDDSGVQAMSLADPRSLSRILTWIGLHLRPRGAAHDWLARTAIGVSVGARLRHRAPQLRAGQLLPDRQPQLLSRLACRLLLLLASAIARRRSNFASGSTSAAAASTAPSPRSPARAGAERSGRACRPATARSSMSRATIRRAAREDLRALPQRIPRSARRRPCGRTSISARRSDAARHLFRVAAGLDSMVVGEPQILGQVKDAFSVAVSAQTRPAPLLNKLFHWAFAVGKRVRSETGAGRGRGLGQLRRRQPGAEDLRQPRRPPRARRRRRRNGQADRAAPQGAGHRPRS